MQSNRFSEMKGSSDVVQEHVWSVPNTSKAEHATESFGNLFQCFSIIMVPSIESVPHVARCICCLSSCCCAPPRRALLCLHCTSHRAVALSNRISSSLSLLKAGQMQLLQLLLV